MMKRGLIGIDRRLDIEWLDAAAALIAQGKAVAEIRERLTQLLAPNQGREATEKTLIVIGRLWWRAPGGLGPMQARALELLPVVEIDWSLAGSSRGDEAAAT